MTAASYIKTLSALHPRPAFKRRALRLSATWRSILFFLMACNQCGNNNSARKKQFPPAWHSSFLRSFSDFSSFSSNACMAILFLNNIQKKLFAEAFKVLDFATPILGVQKPAKPRSSNCGLPSKRNVVLEPESLKAWVAKEGGKIDKRNVVSWLVRHPIVGW